jgi:hypothetical protein
VLLGSLEELQLLVLELQQLLALLLLEHILGRRQLFRIVG